MRFLVTGASSFTGSWFVATLAREGHEVTGTLRRSIADYPELPARRLQMCREAGVTLAEHVEYGSEALLSLIGRGYDAIGWHGADIVGYRSPEFDPMAALERNTRGIREAALIAKAAGVSRLIVTGTVFEPFAGTGDQTGRAVTPYGLSKALSSTTLSFWAEEAGLPVSRFVIANPFGPLEQERFCSYLARSWLAGETPEVRAPEYVRDNVPVDRLAQAYADFATGPFAATICPSGYAESQSSFARRVAAEIGPRVGVATPLAVAEQRDFSEPMTRIGTDALTKPWNEAAFWDALAADYALRFAAPRMG